MAPLLGELRFSVRAKFGTILGQKRAPSGVSIGFDAVCRAPLQRLAPRARSVQAQDVDTWGPSTVYALQPPARAGVR